ncbi:MAG: hypothetical protein IH607_07155 [Firmicutes bacterium]|nr:hypothetical protein [Bacillota bacterium]
MNIQNHIALDCPCAASCERHGNCAACVDNHSSKGSLPFCLRDIGKKEKADRRLARKMDRQKSQA